MSYILLHIIVYIIFILLCTVYLLILYVIDLRLYHDYLTRRQHKFEDQWEKAIFQYLQLRGDPEDFIKKVPSRKYLLLLELLRQFLLSLTGSEYEKIADLIKQKRIYDFLIKRLNSFRTNRVVTSAYFLGLAKIVKAKDLLIKKLDTDSQPVFISCATSLAQIDAVEVVEKILTRAESFKDLSRDSLLFILLEYKQDVCAPLLKLLSSKIPDYQKEAIVSLFRQFKYQESAPEVTKTLTKTQNIDLILECLRFIREIRYVEAHYVVNPMLDHKNPHVSVEAIKTIGKLGAGPLVDKIFSKLFDDNYEVQLAAAVTISQDIPSARDKLNKIAYNVNKERATSIARMVLSEIDLRRYA
ncbi:MAG: hypothetical protein P4L27_13830 [Ignavibacteriaceae bacterium]|nr:hypothetical protein [Ignavibacteriaceae bacterium]